MPGVRRGSTALFVAAAALVVASPLPWFEVQGFGVDAAFSGMDTVALGTVAVTFAGVYAVVALIVRRTGRQVWFLLTLCLGVFCLFITMIVYVSTEIIAGALPLPEPLEDSVPGPGPGLGFVLISAALAMVGSMIGLLARQGQADPVRSGPTTSRPPEAEASAQESDVPLALGVDSDVPEF